MRILEVVKELWRFQCQVCEGLWEDLYEACHTDDGRGGDAVAWRYGGIAAQPPWVDRSCPSCGSPRVQPVPSGRTSH